MDNCTECKKGNLHPIRYEDTFYCIGGTVKVPDLEAMLCDNCGADPVFADQIKRNEIKIAKAKDTQK